MTTRPITFALLATTLSLSAMPALAVASGKVSLAQTSLTRRQQKTAAKAEWKAFLDQNPAAVMHGKKLRTPMPFILRTAGVGGGLLGLKASAIGLLGYAFSGSTSAVQLFWGGLVGGGGATWAGFKLASLHNRRINTEIVRFAQDRGANISDEQLARWASIGKITITRE